MNESQKYRTKRKPIGEPDGFEVVCSIGRIAFDPNAPRSAYVEAFVLIAEHDANGTYSFPNADGSTVTVTVER